MDIILLHLALLAEEESSQGMQPSLNHGRIATVGGAYLVPLEAEKHVKIYPNDSIPYSCGYSDSTLQMSLLGFWYISPKNATWLFNYLKSNRKFDPHLPHWRMAIKNNIGGDTNTLTIYIVWALLCHKSGS